MTGTDSIRLTVRSFVFPPKPVKGFDLGKPFVIRVPPGLDLEGLAERILAERTDQIGFMTVNGKIASGERELIDGDQVDLFGLIMGG